MAIDQSATKCFLIDADFIFKTFAAYLDSNLDPNSLDTFILIAQSEQLQQLLGYTLYTKYINDANDGTINTMIDVNYKYLLDNYLADSIALWTIYYSYDTINFRTTNKSIELKSSPSNSSAINDKQLNRLKYQVQERAQFVDTRARFWILQNLSWFPEYFNISSIYQLSAKQTTYTNSGSLYLGNYGIGGQSFPSCDLGNRFGGSFQSFN